MGYGGKNTVYAQNATASGAITATFTWTPDPTLTSDPPPQTVIVMKKSQADWLNPGGGATGACDDGLNDAPVNNGSGGKTSMGTHYTKMAGAQTISITITPSASVTQNSGMVMGSGVSPDATSGNTAEVYVTVGISPVIITPATPVKYQGNADFITGQQITASLSTGGFSVDPDTYRWSSSGGDLFKTYDQTLTSNQLVLLASADMTMSSFVFYDKRGGDAVTLSCNATVVATDSTSDGSTSQVRIPVTAQSYPLYSIKPTVTVWNIYTGYVQHNPNYQGHNVYGLLKDPTKSYPSGETWQMATISVPAPFSGGVGTFTQLVTPTEYAYTGTTRTDFTANNTKQGLDTQFLYGDVWTVPQLGADGDSPSIADDTNDQPGYTEITASEQFTTYIMYEPASTNSVFVPLASYNWSWSETLMRQNSQWNITASSPATQQSEPSYSYAATNDPPQWSLIHLGD